MAKPSPKAAGGFLKLESRSADAQRRLMLGGASCLTMFIIGVALVALLMPPEEDRLGADAISPAPQPGAAAPDQPSPAVAVQASDSDQNEGQAQAQGATDDPDTEPSNEDDSAPTAEVEETDSAPDGEERPDDGDELARSGDDTLEDPTRGDGQAEDSGGEEEADPGDQWWKRIHGKKCRIAFGDHKRLIMREGRLHKDEVTTYGPFVNQPVAARVRESMDPRLTVHHIGIHPRNKRPSLAYVTLHNGDQDIRGILPLQVSGDQLRLIPAR